MENKTILTILAIVLAVNLVLTGFLLYQNSQSDGGEVYTLYIGLNDSETHEDLDPEIGAEIVDKIVLKYAEGLTRYNASGAYTYDDGDVAHESTLVYIIEGISLKDVYKICDEAKDKLHQSAILITTDKLISEYY